MRLIEGCEEASLKILEYADKIRVASRRGASITRQMLTFSRHNVVVDDIIDISAVVREQKDLIAPLVGDAVSLHVRADVQGLYGECSEDAVAQILFNLCINARDAMPEGGKILIAVESCEEDDLPIFVQQAQPNTEFLCLYVADTGQGMSREVQDHIFDPFFTTKGQGKGTGLGLSVVYGLVQQISGYITVSSELGKGSTFFVYIPRSHNGPSVSKQLGGQVEDIGSIELDGFTALVVEDEADLRAIICDVLKKRGMHVLSAENGQDALVLQKNYEGQIDVLLSDVVMPGMNGMALAREMSNARPGLQVIYMSGYPANGDMAQVDLPDDAYFIAKPMDYDVLCQLIFACLSDTQGGAGDTGSRTNLLKMTAAHWEMQNSCKDPGQG